MFCLEKHSLHKDINESVILEYSAFKLGDVSAINAYSDILINRLERFLNLKEKYVIYVANKSPATPYCKKNTLLVDEKVHQKLGIPLVIAEYTYVYDAKSFYDNNSMRKKTHKEVLKKEDEEKIIGKSTIFFDDSIVSGRVLKATCDALKKLTDEVIFFSSIDLSGGKYIEKDVNDYLFNTEGIPGLIRIVKEDDYVFTTHMIRTIGALSSNKRRNLLGEISDDKRAIFLKAFEVYFGRAYSQ